MKRRILISAISLICCTVVQAESYPERPVKIIAGTAAGGTVDKIARLIGNQLQMRLGQPFVVENKPGAGGTLAAELVSNAKPDGYTLSLTSVPTVAITPVLEKVRYDPVGSYEAVAYIGSQPYVLLVPFESSMRTVADVVAEAKSQAGRFSYSSAGRGTGGHLSGLLFSQVTGAPMLHVPYKGVAPAITDVIGGMVSMTFATTGSSKGPVDGKKLRPLAMTGDRRSPAYPDLPTMEEVGFSGYEVSTWYGITAPAGTPAVIVNLLNKEINSVLADKKLQESLAVDGIMLKPGGSPEDFRNFEVAEQKRWRTVLEKAGLAAK